MKRALLAAILGLVLLTPITASALSNALTPPGAVTAEFDRAQLLLVDDVAKIGAANVAWVGELVQLQALERVVAATVTDLSLVSVNDCFSEWWALAYGSYVYLDGLINKIIAEGGTPSDTDNALAQGFGYLVGLLPAKAATVDCTLEDQAI